MANKKISPSSRLWGRWQDTQWCFCSPSCLMSPRSNTKIVGGTGDQRATIDDCARFWMSLCDSDKMDSPIKITSEVSKGGLCSYRMCLQTRTLFSSPAGATPIAEWEGNVKRFLIIQTSSSCAFSKDEHKFYTWVWEWAWDSTAHLQMFMKDTKNRNAVIRRFSTKKIYI